jgi:hypothetical protein
MNKLISFLIVGGFAAWGMNEITWPEAKVTIHVVDEEAKPIANAKVELSFKKNPPLPDRQSDITVEGVTNADGMFSGSELHKPTIAPELPKKNKH